MIQKQTVPEDDRKFENFIGFKTSIASEQEFENPNTPKPNIIEGNVLSAIKIL